MKKIKEEHSEKVREIKVDSTRLVELLKTDIKEGRIVMSSIESPIKTSRHSVKLQHFQNATYGIDAMGNYKS
jgi:hypothetical protein